MRQLEFLRSTTVTHCGRICYKSRKINLSQVFAGHIIGQPQTATAQLRFQNAIFIAQEVDRVALLGLESSE
jgi:hypothetical protein